MIQHDRSIRSDSSIRSNSGQVNHRIGLDGIVRDALGEKVGRIGLRGDSIEGNTGETIGRLSLDPSKLDYLNRMLKKDIKGNWTDDSES